MTFRTKPKQNPVDDYFLKFQHNSKKKRHLVLWLVNIKVEVKGERNLDNLPTLYVSNHLSYLDIPVLGSRLNGRFVAKNEISNWPIIGFLSKVGNTIFINRNLRFLKTNKSIIFDYISRGNNIILSSRSAE